MEPLSMSRNFIAGRFTVNLLIILVCVTFVSVHCASIGRGNESLSISQSENENSFSHRLSPTSTGVTNPTWPAKGNMYYNTVGFPMLPVPGGVNHPQAIFPFQHFVPTQVPQFSQTMGGSLAVGVRQDAANNSTSGHRKKRVKGKKVADKDKIEESPVSLEVVESKTSDEGTERGCPGCEGGTCNSQYISPNTNISGIPVIQILFGIFAGLFWAGIFLFVLKNFIEQKESGEGYGYSPSPQYGAPQYGAPQYGAPAPAYGAPSSGYNTQRMSYGYGRKMNELSNRVWSAIDKLAASYNNNY